MSKVDDQLKVMAKMNAQLKQQHDFNVKLTEAHNTQLKNMQTVIAVALHLADLLKRASIGQGTVKPLFPLHIPDKTFQAVWARMNGGEGIGVSVKVDAAHPEDDGVLVHIVKPEQVVAAPKLVTP